MEFHPSLLNLCLWVLFVVLQSHRCLGCADDERTALLEIKASVMAPDVYFSTWTEDESSDYCAWDGIKCSKTTGCVSQLYLRYAFREYNGITGNISDACYTNALLNASLFMPFKGLQNLDISNNDIKGWKSHQGIDKLAKLKALQVLNIGGNCFNNSVLQLLSELTSLKTLNLDDLRGISSSEIVQGVQKLSNLKKLEVLSLANNNLNTKILAPLGELTSLKTLHLGNNYIGEGSTLEISQGFEKLLKLKRLQLLSLEENNLNNTNILVPLSKLTSLRNLNLRGNQLRMGSSIEISQGFCELKKLQGIDLSENNLEGEIPLCLVNFTALRYLFLSNNQLSGNIPPSLTANMTSLKALDFSYNKFTGSLPLSPFNLRSLQYLSFEGNQFEGSQFEGTALITSSLEQKFQLKYLYLSNCNLNTSTKRLLKFLHGHSELQSIDLSHNNIQGKFPLWLVANNTQLKNMFLNNNLLSGDIHFPLRLRTNLEVVDLSRNHIEGHLQTNLGHVLQRASYLNLSQNHFEGSIPTSLRNLQYLWVLDLSNNNFTGEIPGSLQSLYLILSNNRLHGQIFLNTSVGGSVVRFNNNQFTGIVPHNIEGLSTLDVSKNNISGRIPSWIANLTYVTTIVMGGNSFHGPIPLKLCNLAELQFLDLSENELSGIIPSSLNLTSLRYMDFQGNKLSGSLPPALLRSPNLVTLNLNHNNFSGSLPGWLGLLENLGILLLKGNRLSGFVPNKLCRSNKIWILDLSNNVLSGEISPCFGNISFGKSGGFVWDSPDPLAATSIGSDGVPLFGKYFDRSGIIESYVSQEEVEFMTKGLSSSYKGDILNYMSGMDLSCNNFSGRIPHELGALTEIHALNLSHNQFTGPIPKTLSKLTELESMDLSHNKLSGEIPSELTDLTFLSTFVVAYNNLSGRLPNMYKQFSTFTETSYQGNPYLCGPPLHKQCNGASAPIGSVSTADASLSDVFGVDPISFLASSAGAYGMSLLALVIVLYINPYWRRLWFDFIDACLSFMFPFWSEAFYRVSNPLT